MSAMSAQVGLPPPHAVIHAESLANEEPVDLATASAPPTGSLTMRSSLPSPSKSPVLAHWTLLPHPVSHTPAPLSCLPSDVATATWLLKGSATTSSSLPSPFRSATAAQVGRGAPP